jgi:hypothetical protein
MAILAAANVPRAFFSKMVMRVLSLALGSQSISFFVTQ